MHTLGRFKSIDRLAAYRAVVDAIPVESLVDHEWAVFVREAVSCGNGEAAEYLLRHCGDRLWGQVRAEMGDATADVLRLELRRGVGGLCNDELVWALKTASALDRTFYLHRFAGIGRHYGSRDCGGSASREMGRAGKAKSLVIDSGCSHDILEQMLLSAAGGGARRVVDLLVGLGVDPNCQDASGCSALRLAVSRGFVSVARRLLSAGAVTSDEIGPVIIDASEEAISVLIEFGADLDAVDAAGYCALVAAVEAGDAYRVEFIVGRGCALDIRAVGGQTALHRAVAMEEAAMVELLLSAGADAGMLDFDGRRPVDLSRSLHMQRLF